VLWLRLSLERNYWRLSLDVMRASTDHPSGLGIESHFGCARRGEGDSMLSKSDLIQTITDAHSDKLTRKDVKTFLESLAAVGHKELKKNGAFVLPGFAKFVVVKKAATKARKGINPFTKEPTVFKAKPARKVLKGRPVKALKDAIA
jgi:DNA-binding protein HU-beta